MFITSTHIESGVDAFTCVIVSDVEALKGIRYTKVAIDLSKFPLVNMAFDPVSNKGHRDYLLNNLDGETASLLRREAEKNMNTDEEKLNFYKEIDIVRGITRAAQQGHNKISFVMKKD